MVYKNNSMTCQEKVDVAKRSFSASLLKQQNYTYEYNIEGRIPRWWFMTISNCRGGPNGTEAGLMIEYWNVHFTNRDGLFQYEFSKDVQGIAEMCIFFLIFYALLLIVLGWMQHHAKQKQLQCLIIKYVFASVLIEWIGIIFLFAHYIKLAHDGVGVKQLESAHFCKEYTTLATGETS